MTRQTLLLFIDAFRHDYLARTRFLRSLAKRSRVGAMREYFGFLPRGGYFGGLSPSETGFTNMFCCDPAASPFGVARGLPHLDALDADDRSGARAWVETQARQRMTPFAAAYAGAFNIPLSLLPWFDLAEKYAPWDRRVGYRSIFHELEDRGDACLCAAWPDTNHLPDHSDAGLVEHVLRTATPAHRLVHIHLQELDGIGHAYGPESAEVLAAIGRADALAERLVRELAARVDALDVILFSDHGMVSVTGTVDVWDAVRQTGFRAGRDVIFFLDSTMARFWFPTQVARDAIIRALSKLPGRVLDGRDLRRLDIDGCDRRNGELIFLAEPGHVIVPNFFQARADHTRGMHGYEPDCPDNMGIFLVHDPARQDPAEAGVVGPAAVYTELRRTLELGPAAAPVRAVAWQVPDRPAGAFTQHPDPAAELVVSGQMHRVVEAVFETSPVVEAVVLCGSFGRGEGGMRRNAAGRFVPVNDYDLLVLAPDVSPRAREAFDALGTKLAADFGTDFVHFSLWPDLNGARTPTIANVDLRYGSRVLWGDPELLEELPRFAGADIPPVEGLQLLYNRLGGLLTGLHWPGRTSGRGSVDGYLLNQVMKARIALGDWRLLRHGAYDVSYRKRHERFAWLAPSFALGDDERTGILEGYLYKIHPDRVTVGDLPASAMQTAAWLVAAIVNATGDLTRRPVEDATDAAGLYRDILNVGRDAVGADNAHAASRLQGDALVRVRPDTSEWVRSAIYASFPLVARAAAGDERAFANACDRLDECLTPPWPRELTPDNWEIVRRRVAHAWLALVG